MTTYDPNAHPLATRCVRCHVDLPPVADFCPACGADNRDPAAAHPRIPFHDHLGEPFCWVCGARTVAKKRWRPPMWTFAGFLTLAFVVTTIVALLPGQVDLRSVWIHVVGGRGGPMPVWVIALLCVVVAWWNYFDRRKNEDSNRQ